MNLFFETENQAMVFLSAVPVGFLVAVMFTLIGGSGRFRALWDVLCLLVCGLSAIMIIVLTRDGGLRLYHLLAMCVGACLYLFGVYRLIKYCLRVLQKR